MAQLPVPQLQGSRRSRRRCRGSRRVRRLGRGTANEWLVCKRTASCRGPPCHTTRFGSASEWDSSRKRHRSLRSATRHHQYQHPAGSRLHSDSAHTLSPHRAHDCVRHASSLHRPRSRWIQRPVTTISRLARRTGPRPRPRRTHDPTQRCGTVCPGRQRRASWKVARRVTWL